MGIQVKQICDGAFFVNLPEIGVSWLFNAWPDIIKYVIENGYKVNGVAYTELTQTIDILPQSNFLEFPLLHCLFNQGMIFEGERPVILGNESQIIRAREAFMRGLYGFQNSTEMLGSFTNMEEAEALIGEIEGLGFNGIQEVDNIVHFLPLMAEKNILSCIYKELRITSPSPNVFELTYEEDTVEIDCNLGIHQRYNVPFKLTNSLIKPTDFQIIDTGEADGFSSNYSCNHTIIRWHGKTLCVDLPMNVSEMLFHVGISNSEIDAVVFTHNHDDHIGDLAFLFQSHKKIDVLCPKIIWRAITRKAAAVYDCTEEEISSFVRYIPLPFGEEFDYGGLVITPHLSIHPVPTAIYRFCVKWKSNYKSYVHLCDVLNFERCKNLLEIGSLDKDRFLSYKQFMLQNASLKKVDVGTKQGGELFSVHGSWRDFVDDSSDEIVLTHVNPELVEPQAVESVGHVSKFGSVRNLIKSSRSFFEDMYKEKVTSYFCQALTEILGREINENELSDLPEWHDIIEINVVGFSPEDIVRDSRNNPDSIVVWLTGCGCLKIDKNGLQARVQSGDIIGDIDAVLEYVTSCELRAENYANVIFIPKELFRRLVLLLCQESDHEFIETIQKQHSIRLKLLESRFFPSKASISLQNSVAMRAQEVDLIPHDPLLDGLYIGCNSRDFRIQINGMELEEKAMRIPVFGSLLNGIGAQENFQVEIRRTSSVLYVAVEYTKWLMNVPLIHYRLHEIVRWRRMSSLFY
ncbi:MAG: MBL fold metallo-hydrolase [Candidatus Latescibacterota bacterium]|nr:MBL fold metallo-hydrolase [Candidatus Latescibacterota bacterium]